MRRNRLWIAFACMCFVVACNTRAVEVRLRVAETANAARAPAAVTTGVPFARGVLKDAAKLSVTMDGKPLAAQFAAIAPWDDGSVRWALMDVQVPVAAGGAAELVVSDGGRNPAPARPVTVQNAADAVRVSTGPLKFAVSRKKPGLLESLAVDGKELLSGIGRGLVVYLEGGEQVVAGPPAEVTVEQGGPVRATVCVRGTFGRVHNGLLGYTARITACAGGRAVKVHLWLENHGAMGYWQGGDNGASKNMEWFCFDGMAVELGLALGGKLTAACEDVQAADRMKVLQVCKHSIAQEKVQYPKGPFYTWDDFVYKITSGETELKTGARTDGVVTVAGDAGGLTAAIRDFWQNYEKAIELEDGRLKLWLWPTEGTWPRPRGNLHSGEFYDKDLQALAKPGVYYLPGAVHKGHEFVLDFSGSPPQQAAAELSSPLRALASAEYYASTGAAPGLFAPPAVTSGDSECDFKLASWMRMTRSAADPASETGLFHAQRVSTESTVGYSGDTTYWFGWLDYGDISVPGRGPVSLHYGWTWIMLANALRTGDMNFLRLGEQMARHRIDVDQLWSDRDLPQCRGLQRGEFNFPSFHCYRLYRPPDVTSNWLAGVVLYYMLTGEPKALECARRNAEGLVAGWEWIAQKKPWGGPQGDMLANARSISSWCAMYDLTADKKWLDAAMGLFNTNVTQKWKDYGPFLHDPTHQIQSQDYVKDDMRYCYSIEALCGLHQHTGDENVMKLLAEGCEKEFPESFYDAPLFVSGLYAYVGLRTDNADYIDRAVEQFIAGFPESKCPPVFLPDNSTWSQRSAMMLRSGNLLQYALWKRKAAK